MSKIFVDTGNVEEIKEIKQLGIVDGCTTNPKILSKEENIDFETRMKEILELVDGPVSIEVTSNDKEEMVRQARKFDSWSDNVVVKLPMTNEGIKATKIVSDEGVDVNVTACMAPDQVLIAAKAGARFASIFMGRIGDMGYNAEQVIQDSSELIEDYTTEICVGSIRKAYDVQRAFLAGADIVTVPPQYIEKLIYNPRTESSIDEFLEFWEGR